jgi:hypothetical protein
MKVDSSASYFLRQQAALRAAGVCALVLAAVVLGGCSAAGETSGSRTIDVSEVPFTFNVPADFTKEPVDQFDSRGDVVAAAGIDKLDLIAVRRIAPGVRVPQGDVAHVVQGHRVSSRLHAFKVGKQRWAIECQWASDRRTKVLDACREAVGSIVRR